MIHLLLAIIYLAFISLGLPDSLLGSAWPVMYSEFDVPVSYSGVIFFIIALGTVISSLLSDRLTRRLGTGLITAISVAMTAVALFGFSVSHQFFMLCLWAIPYGLGAGSVDAALNNYVAIHFASRHMSWLHCMWGVGASLGPYIMGNALTAGLSWNTGYRRIGILQTALVIILVLSLPLWKRKEDRNNVASDAANDNATPRPMKTVIRVRGVIFAMLCFFAYCALEQTTGLWASSYLVLERGISAETAARYASLFFIGITVGRAISGFITFRLNDKQMVFLGQGIILIGIALMLLPLSNTTVLAGLLIIGLGCAPIYPSMIHATPVRFGKNLSQAVIGLQMASAYIGTSLMPPLFGALSKLVGLSALPFFLLLLLTLMILAHSVLVRKTG